MGEVATGGWSVSACVSGGVAVAHPSKHHGRKMQKGELYGRVFPSSDAAFAAMREAGYSADYRRGPRVFITCRIPRRLREECVRRPEAAMRLIARAVPESDAGFVDGGLATKVYQNPKFYQACGPACERARDERRARQASRAKKAGRR